MWFPSSSFFFFLLLLLCSSSSFFFFFFFSCSSFVVFMIHYHSIKASLVSPFLDLFIVVSSTLLACQDMVLTGLQVQEGNSVIADLPICWLWAIGACHHLSLVHSAGHHLVAPFGAATPSFGWRCHRGRCGRHGGSTRVLLVFGLH